MSAKKYLTTIIFIAFITSSSSIIAQNEAMNASDLINKVEEAPQFLIRTERNGKVKYVECAMPNFYFHKATSSTPKVANHLDKSEFTSKGGGINDEYYGYAFFLVQNGLIKDCNASGDFSGQPGGLYTISRFSYPLSVAPESFKGKNINTVENHPLFEKDSSMQNAIIRLLAPKLTVPVVPKQPTISADYNMLGQIQSDIPTGH